MTQQHKVSLFIIAFSFCFVSCSNKVNHTLNGWWSIDVIYYKGYDIRVCLLSNSIVFHEKNNAVELPVTQNRCDELFTEFVKKGEWNIIQNNNSIELEFQGENKIFAGKHHVRFIDDYKNRMLLMEIQSDSLFIVCRKGLFEYGKNINTVKELVDMSNKPDSP